MALTIVEVEDQLAPLMLGDLVELQQWLRRQPFRDLELLPAEQAAARWGTAFRQATALHLYAPAGRRLLDESVEAQAFVVYLMLRRRQPQWTYQQVLDQVPAAALGRWAARFRALHGLTDATDTIDERQTAE